MPEETHIRIFWIIFFTAVISLAVLQKVYGEDYKFNMTKELKEEGRALQVCIETSIKLEFCDTRYGGINTNYGEAIK